MVKKVYIGSMNMRGKWADKPHDNCIIINVTSAQEKLSKNRRDFSPMTEIIGGYKGFWNFESYWQQGKVFEDIPHEISKDWWLKLKEPKRRYPSSKGKTVLYAEFDDFPGEQLDYVSSRKKVYVPEYYNLIKDREQVLYYQNKLKKHDIIIYDFDGPRKDNGDVTTDEVTVEYLREKINQTQFPFGHGYVVAGLILGITPLEYI